ncbi:MAG: helix-turn-helix domain-containing protein [Myxococcales bacterium]|jgi:rhodanese-related sulfurtransferase/biotin operon repressor|nr:helix-turn-helix domain-containing protein [Myxococcales bacterium]
MTEREVVYGELARVAGALASPVRARALHLLFQKPRSIEELAAELGAGVANTAAHMKALREAGLVRAERSGKYAVQHPNGEAPLRLFLALREAAEAISPPLQLLAQERDEAASEVGPDALEALHARKAVVLADLRPEPEYRAGHLPGAVSLPFDGLAEGWTALPEKKRILVYCRGKYCPKARRGTALLRGKGLRAERLLFGVPEWRGEGRPLEVSA